MLSLIKVKPDGEKLISSADEWHLTELQSDDISPMSEWPCDCTLADFPDNPLHFQLQPLQVGLSEPEMTHEGVCRV